MISRVAENCFWLLRYLERADNMARLLQVNRAFQLDVSLPESERWQPVIVVSGEAERAPVDAIHDGEAVQEYLTWHDECPVGIVASVRWARENARMIRELINLEMWESINAFWHWVHGGEGRRLYGLDRDAFYRRIKDTVALIIGICQNTQLRGEALDFMRLGMALERAGQTARIMDVKYHLVGPTSADGVETAVEAAQWIALLRSCSAADAFSRHHRAALRSSEVVDFLLKEEVFPRSVAHCIHRACRYFGRIEVVAGRRLNGHRAAWVKSHRSGRLLRHLADRLSKQTTEQVLEAGLHDELTRIVDTIADVCDAIHTDYFEPALPELMASTASSAHEHPA